MIFEYLLVFGYTLLFLYVIRKAKFFRNTGIANAWLEIAFVTKIIAGIALSIIYTKYYTDRSTADVFKFFDDSKILFEVLRTDPLGFLKIVFHIDAAHAEMKFWYNKDVLFNDNQTMIVLNTLFRFFSIGNYAVHVVFINFLSFTGLIALYRIFQPMLQNKAKVLFILIMFLPSVLLWGSGLLKDSLLLFALGSFLYSFNKITQAKASLKHVFVFICGFILLVFTKVYILLIIMPALLAWIWSQGNTNRVVVVKFTACYVAFFLLAFSIGSISNKYDVVDILYYKQQSFYAVADSTKAGSVISIPKFNPTTVSVIYHTPTAIARVFIRPSIFDSRSPLILMGAIENLFILILILSSLIIFLRRHSVRNLFVNGSTANSQQVPYRMTTGEGSNALNTPLFWLSISLVLCLFALTGLTTPVLGAMVRYKVPALPFLMFIIASLYNKEKLRKVAPSS